MDDLEPFVITVTLNPKTGGVEVVWPEGQHIATLGILDIAWEQVMRNALPSSNIIVPLKRMD